MTSSLCFVVFSPLTTRPATGRVPVVDGRGELCSSYRALQRATVAGATVVADVLAFREDVYNVGERELAAWLTRAGYSEEEAGSGVWTPGPPRTLEPAVGEDRDEEQIAAAFGLINSQNFTFLQHLPYVISTIIFRPWVNF